MAFGLTQWLISFVIFLIVLTVITWSAVHLGKKSQNSTDIIARFLDVDYSIESENTSLGSTIVYNSTSRVIESTDGPTLFALNTQDSEIDTMELYNKMLQTLLSAKNSSISSTEDDITTAIFTSTIVNNDSWSENTTIKAYNMSEQPFVLNNYQNFTKKVLKPSNHISQTIYPAITHGAKFLDVDRLRESDSYRLNGVELTDHRDEGNETSNTFAIFSFGQVLSGAKQSNTIQQTKMTQSPHTTQNERFETPTIPLYLA